MKRTVKRPCKDVHVVPYGHSQNHYEQPILCGKMGQCC